MYTNIKRKTRKITFATSLPPLPSFRLYYYLLCYSLAQALSSMKQGKHDDDIQ